MCNGDDLRLQDKASKELAIPQASEGKQEVEGEQGHRGSPGYSGHHLIPVTILAPDGAGNHTYSLPGVTCSSSQGTWMSGGR